MLKLYSTLSRQKQEFKPLGDVVNIYVCGVTPYDYCHIGHAMSYVVFDVLRRYLRFKGYPVRYIQNFTDIDDKIINRARQTGKSPSELAQEHIANYFRDMDALRIERADLYPRVTEEIAKIQELVGGLLDKGHAYQGADGVYFRVKSFPSYGRLSNVDLSETSASVDRRAEGKEHSMDFALWKASKPGEPYWESPWGRGRPGWHIECSAMSLKYLGSQLDIHGGGQDLIFPHHENEIAQSESYTGVSPFARCWLHNGMVMFGEDKMSKSLGNLITIRDALSRYSVNAIRLFILSSHYRSPLKYSEEGLLGMEKGVERLLQALNAAGGKEEASRSLPAEPYLRRFIEAMDEDLNTPQALAVLFDMTRDINKGATEGRDLREARKALAEMLGLFGVVPVEKGKEVVEAAHFIELLVSLRREMKDKKEWDRADKIRQQLKERGIILEDTPEGTRWKKVK